MGKLFGRKRHALTKPALKRRALEESGVLAGFVEEREGQRPQNDSIVQDGGKHRVTLHDEETARLYVKQKLLGVEKLRDGFAARGIHSSTLDGVYKSPKNEADLRTIATALEEMAGRLR